MFGVDRSFFHSLLAEIVNGVFVHWSPANLKFEFEFELEFEFESLPGQSSNMDHSEDEWAFEISHSTQPSAGHLRPLDSTSYNIHTFMLLQNCSVHRVCI